MFYDSWSDGEVHTFGAIVCVGLFYMLPVILLISECAEAAQWIVANVEPIPISGCIAPSCGVFWSYAGLVVIRYLMYKADGEKTTLYKGEKILAGIGCVISLAVLFSPLTSLRQFGAALPIVAVIGFFASMIYTFYRKIS